MAVCTFLSDVQSLHCLLDGNCSFVSVTHSLTGPIAAPLFLGPQVIVLFLLLYFLFIVSGISGRGLLQTQVDRSQQVLPVFMK